MFVLLLRLFFPEKLDYVSEGLRLVTARDVMSVLRVSQVSVVDLSQTRLHVNQQHQKHFALN